MTDGQDAPLFQTGAAPLPMAASVFFVRRSVRAQELQVRRPRQDQGLHGLAQQTAGGIAPQHGNGVRPLDRQQQEAPVRRDREFAGAGGFGGTTLQQRQRAVVAHRKHDDVMVVSASHRVQEAAIRGEMDRARAMRTGEADGREIDDATQARRTVIEVELHDLAGHFQGDIGMPAIGGKRHVARPAAGRELHVRGLRRMQRALGVLTGCIAINVDAIATQVRHQHMTAIR